MRDEDGDVEEGLCRFDSCARSVLYPTSQLDSRSKLGDPVLGSRDEFNRSKRQGQQSAEKISPSNSAGFFISPFSRAAILWEQVMAKRNSACRTEHSCNVNLRKAAFHYARSRLPQARARKMTAGPLSHFPSRAMYQWLVLGQLPTYAVHGQGCSTVAKWRPSTAEALRVGTMLASRVPR